jgi:hypothetical protein
MPLKDLSDGPRTSDAPVPETGECNAMFDKFLSDHKGDKDGMTDEESKKFRTAFDDPKFREMLADYMEEISDVSSDCAPHP